MKVQNFCITFNLVRPFNSIEGPDHKTIYCGNSCHGGSKLECFAIVSLGTTLNIILENASLTIWVKSDVLLNVVMLNVVATASHFCPSLTFAITRCCPIIIMPNHKLRQSINYAKKVFIVTSPEETLKAVFSMTIVATCFRAFFAVWPNSFNFYKFSWR